MALNETQVVLLLCQQLLYSAWQRTTGTTTQQLFYLMLMNMEETYSTLLSSQLVAKSSDAILNLSINAALYGSSSGVSAKLTANDMQSRYEES